MTDIKTWFNQLDFYLDPKNSDTIQRDLCDAFLGKDGTRHNKPFSSPIFKAGISALFSKTLSEYIEIIRQNPEFKKAVEKDNQLETKLNQLSILNTLKISLQTQKISEKDWKNGERGDLYQQYIAAKKLYLEIRNAFYNISKQ